MAILKTVFFFTFFKRAIVLKRCISWVEIICMSPFIPASNKLLIIINSLPLSMNEIKNLVLSLSII